jgi:hypothetical protein
MPARPHNRPDRPAIREFNEQWIVNIPELKTRPVLLEALKTEKDIRRKIFQSAQAMESIALIPNSNLAEYCLAMWWREQRREIYNRFQDRLRARTGNDKLFNEMYGCLRNVYFNARRKANVRCQIGPKTHSKFSNDIVREYVW